MTIGRYTTARLRHARSVVQLSSSIPRCPNRPAGIVALAGVAAAMAPVLTGRPGLSQAAGEQTVERPGVSLVYEVGLAPPYPDGIADVVSVAKRAFDDAFPELAKPNIRVEARQSRDYYEGTVTDRQQTVYVSVGTKGLGEYFRPDAGPVGILCQAVAELHNPQRLPGFDRYVAHRYLAPAVAETLGADVLPRAELQPGADDVTGMLTLMSDPAYATVHPDFAAASALADIDRELGLEVLRELVAAVPAGAPEAFAAFREAALAREPALGDAFALYDEATALPIEEDGTCLIASFEADEPATRTGDPVLSALGDLVLIVSRQFEMSQSNEWATHGELSLKLHAEELHTYMSVSIEDPDWKYKDWARFARLELDIKVEGDAPVQTHVALTDDLGRRHGMVDVFGRNLQPGEQHHVAYPLSPASLRGKQTPFADYFDGSVRADEIGTLRISVYKPLGPFTLYIDNIRLTPRETAAPRRVPASRPGVGEPATAEEPPEQAAAEAAAALLRQALAHKQRGQLQQAEAALRQALRVDPENVEAHRVLAWTLVAVGRKAEAAAEFRRVIDLTQDAQVQQEAEKALERLR